MGQHFGPVASIRYPLARTRSLWACVWSVRQASTRPCLGQRGSCELETKMPPLLYNADVEKWVFFLRFKHTVLPMVTSDPVFWGLIALHVYILRKQRELLEQGDSLPELDWKASSMLWSLLTFFVVFYGGHCYNRFYVFYGACTGLKGVIGEWAYLIRSHFDGSPAIVKWNMLRLLLGGMEIQLASLGGSDSGGGKGLDESEWEGIRKHGFLSKNEIATLQKYKGSKPFLPAVWALAEVRVALKTKLSRAAAAKAAIDTAVPDDSQGSFRSLSAAKKFGVTAEHEAEAALLQTPAAMAVFEDFEQAVLKFKSNCGAASNLLKMPVPFAYFHVLKLLLIIAMALTSYALIELEHAQVLISMVVYVIILTIMIGLQAVAVAMSDPFGDDDIDFDLKYFLQAAYDNAVALLTDERVPLGNSLPDDMDLNFPLASTQAAINARVFKNAFDNNGNKTALPKTRESPMSPKRPSTPPSSSAARGKSMKPSGYRRLEEAPAPLPPPG